MKKVVFAIIGSLLFTISLAQIAPTHHHKRLQFGFDLGVNYSYLLHNNELPGNAEDIGGIGFRLGSFAAYAVSQHISVVPRAEISFQSADIIFTNTDGSTTTYEIMPTSLEFAMHFNFRKATGVLRPHFLFGPNVRIPVSKNGQSQPEFATATDIALDIGIGFEKLLKNLQVGPEFRYSFGLLDINRNPALNKLMLHSVAMVINFKS